ncbi:MAG: hypothetical protein QM528_08550 [Phycisphaerales bacterium]|nr:hypothetical protein [Phycisphaerales bacterium]
MTKVILYGVLCLTMFIPQTIYAKVKKSLHHRETYDSTYKKSRKNLLKITDTVLHAHNDSFLYHWSQHSGFLGVISKLITRLPPPLYQIQIDHTKPFVQYEGWIINKIYIEQLNWRSYESNRFSEVQNLLFRAGNQLHETTKIKTIRSYLQIKEGGTLSAYVVADNERIIRNLPFLQNVQFIIVPIDTLHHLLDVHVISKDVFSLSGEAALSTQSSGEIRLREENLLGRGIRLDGGMYLDLNRRKKVGLNIGFQIRNIMGTFINFNGSYQAAANAFNSNQRQERFFSGGIVKPLQSPYSKWTYTIEYNQHITTNQYTTDSAYNKLFKYNYNEVNSWIGYNFGNKKWEKIDISKKIRKFLAFSGIVKQFFTRPDSSSTYFDNLYRSIYGGLLSFSVFKQSFHQTPFIYAFERAEDVPQGINGTANIGYTSIDRRKRLYLGADFQWSFFSKKSLYYSFLVRSSSYLYQQRPEDITILGSFDFFTNLFKLSKKWQQRFFFNTSYAKLINVYYSPPLLISSDYGLPEFSSLLNFNSASRLTFKGETVFSCSQTLLGFRFALFAFTNSTFLAPNNGDLLRSYNFTSLGGGVRARNDFLIFGTLELRGYYFPQDYPGLNKYKIDFRSDLRFRYNSNFIRKPSFIEIN